MNGADNRSKTQQITQCICCVLFYLNGKTPELIPAFVSLPIEEQNRLFRCSVPSLPAVDIRSKFSHALCRLGIRLKVFITIPSSVTCPTRRAHQILGYCWPRRLHAAAAAQHDRQSRT